jgi:hypothetical protein
MTRDRDIERVLDRWFIEGPAHMPDEFFDAVLDQVDRIPQRRLARLQTRLLDMHLNLRLAAAAVAILVVAGFGAAWFSQNKGVAVSPTATPGVPATSSPALLSSPTPSITAAPSAAAQLVPVPLRHGWTGPTRDVAGLTPAPIAAGLVLSGDSLYFNGGDSANSSALYSTASTEGTDQLRVVLSLDDAGCTEGTAGTYRFTVSPGGGYLSLAVVDDPCKARTQAVSGNWERSACPDAGRSCLGDLEAGAHASGNFNPFVPRASYAYAYGRLTYSVPDGWSNTVDGPDGYMLTKQAAPDSGGIFAFSTAIADSQAAGCPGTVEPGVGTSAKALANWLTTLPGLVTTTPRSVTVGGLSGRTIDVRLSPSWKRTCPYSEGKAYVPMFTNGNLTDNFDWGLTAGGRMRLFLLNLPDGRTMLVDVEAPDASTFDALVPDAMPVIQSFQFHP